MAAYAKTPLDPFWQFILDETSDEPVKRVRFNTLPRGEDPVLSFTDFFTDFGEEPVNRKGMPSPKILREGKYSRRQVEHRDDELKPWFLFGPKRGYRDGRTQKAVKSQRSQDNRDGISGTMNSNNISGETSSVANNSLPNLPPGEIEGGKMDDDSSNWSLLNYRLTQPVEGPDQEPLTKRGWRSKFLKDSLTTKEGRNDGDHKWTYKGKEEEQVAVVKKDSATSRFRGKTNIIDEHRHCESRDDFHFDMTNLASFPEEVSKHSKVTEKSHTSETSQDSRIRRFYFQKPKRQRSVESKISDACSREKIQSGCQPENVPMVQNEALITRKARDVQGVANKESETNNSFTLSRDLSFLELLQYARQASFSDDRDQDARTEKMQVKKTDSFLNLSFFNNDVEEKVAITPPSSFTLDLWRLFDGDDKTTYDKRKKCTIDGAPTSTILLTNGDKSNEVVDQFTDAGARRVYREMIQGEDRSNTDIDAIDNLSSIQPNMLSVNTYSNDRASIATSNLATLNTSGKSLSAVTLDATTGHMVSDTAKSIQASPLSSGQEKPAIFTTSKENLTSTIHHEVCEDELEFWFRIEEARNKSITNTRLMSRVVCCNINRYLENPEHSILATDFPDLRVVADEESSQKPVTITGAAEQDLMGLIVVPSDEIAERRGPQSVYMYEYETGTHMDISFRSFGGRPSETFKLATYTSPPAFQKAPNDVLIKIEASTISRTDCRIQKGEWWREGNVPLPLIPGVDLVGKVQTIDSRTAKHYKLKQGDRVISLIKWGGNSRYTRISPEQLVRVPESLDPAEAVCLAETYLAAFQVLHHGQRIGLRYKQQSLAGKSILVIGALSNIGRAIVELAKEAGAPIVYALGSDKQKDVLNRFGATQLSRKVENWPPELLGTIDVIVDSSTVFNDESSAYLKSLQGFKGEYIFMGTTTMEIEELISKWTQQNKLICTAKPFKMMNKIHAYDVYASWEINTEGSKRDLGHLIKLLEKGTIKPRVLDRMPLIKVARAHEIVDTKRLQGHLVCEPWIRSMQRAVYL